MLPTKRKFVFAECASLQGTSIRSRPLRFSVPTPARRNCSGVGFACYRPTDENPWSLMNEEQVSQMNETACRIGQLGRSLVLDIMFGADKTNRGERMTLPTWCKNLTSTGFAAGKRADANLRKN